MSGRSAADEVKPGGRRGRPSAPRRDGRRRRGPEKYHHGAAVKTAVSFFYDDSKRSDGMGFGSYDESEQEKQEIDADYDDDDAEQTARNTHDGSVEYDIGASNDELLDRLQQIKEADD
jgi:hypothetical protein